MAQITLPSEKFARAEKALGLAYSALAFSESHGMATYDISDVKSHKIILWTFENPSIYARMVRLAFYGAFYIAPLTSRKLMGIKPIRFPHALAMLACAYVELANIMPDAAWIVHARQLLEQVAEDAVPDDSGEAWGFPFPWFTYGGTMAANAGTSHGTMWAANAFYSFYLRSHDNWALEHACRACDFLAYGLHSTDHESGALSKSYTKFDNSQCINVNADMASVLVRLGRDADRPQYVDIGIRMLRFVLENQNQDGSWSYDLPMGGRPWAPNIDGFHTGMVLSALLELAPEIGNEPGLQAQCKFALDKGLTFYIDHLFTPDGQPMYAVGQHYPIDPYSCAQAIMTLTDACRSTFAEMAIRKRADLLLHNVVNQTTRLMLEPDGSFLTARYRLRKMRLKSLRWAQAVLCLALVRYSRLLLCQLNGEANNIEPAYFQS
jgi:hypothetical protein